MAVQITMMAATVPKSAIKAILTLGAKVWISCRSGVKWGVVVVGAATSWVVWGRAWWNIFVVMGAR